MRNTTQWPPWEVTSLRRNLAELASLVRAAGEQKQDIETLTWLARLLVVRSSGYVEQSVHIIIRGFVAEKSGGYVRTFAHSWLERSQNPSPDTLRALLGRFDASLESDFEAFLKRDDEKYGRELSFMVDRRNRIAHGLNEGIGHARALALVDVAQDVTDWFVLRLNPFR
jgi:hypothetical protein